MRKSKKPKEWLLCKSSSSLALKKGSEKAELTTQRKYYIQIYIPINSDVSQSSLFKTNS